jgi:hypothetical protein
MPKSLLFFPLLVLVVTIVLIFVSKKKPQHDAVDRKTEMENKK